MTEAERNIFDAYSVLMAHINLLARIVDGGSPENIRDQAEIVRTLAREFANLPRPQQKAA